MDAITLENPPGSGRRQVEARAAQAWADATLPDARGKPSARRKIWFGAAHADYREFPTQRSMPARISPSHVGLVASLEGEAVVVSPSGQLSIRPGALALLTRPEPITVVGQAGTRTLVLYLARAKLHRLASEAHGGGRRVSTAAAWSLSAAGSGNLAAALAEIEILLWSDGAEAGPNGEPLSERLHRAALEALVRCAPVDEALPLSRAVTDAVRRVRENPDGAWSVIRLAAAAGVTPKHLQRSFHDHLGKGVEAFILETRLQQARASLSTAHDSRPLWAIAASLGFGKPGSFSRAYIRQFGEPPSETRARAVRARGVDD